jgi:hypothetical protein
MLVSTSSELVMETDISQWVEEYGPSKQEKNNNNGHAVCISWCLEDQYLLMMSFGHTIHIDATHKVTNISNLMLLTISIQDRFGKACVVARFWIPNQKQWLFRYIGAYRKTQLHIYTYAQIVCAKFVMCICLFTEKHIYTFTHKFSNLA